MSRSSVQHANFVFEAMKKMAASNVLIVGAKGLGVEIGPHLSFTTFVSLIRSIL